MKAVAKTTAEFIRTYKAPLEGTRVTKVLDFLLRGAQECPKRFFDKRHLAKLAFGLGKLPVADSDHVKKHLDSVLSSVEKNLSKHHRAELVRDPIQGVRCTIDDDDLFMTKHRRKRTRLQSAARSLKATDSIISASKLNSALRAELSRSRAAIGLLDKAIEQLPQLPAPKKPASE